MNIEMDNKESKTILVRKDHIIWVLGGLLVVMFIGGMFRHHMSEGFERGEILRSGTHDMYEGRNMMNSKAVQEAPGAPTQGTQKMAPGATATGSTTIPIPN